MNRRLQLLVLWLILAPSSHAETLGRLFFTPAQRAAWDQQRQLQPELESREGALLSVDGQVRRSSGRHTTWINGRASTEAVPLPDGVRHLRVGEAIRLESGERTDILKGGRLIVSHPTDRP